MGGPAASPFVVSLRTASPVELIRGKRADLVVEVERRNEFRGEIVISVGELPPGVVAEALTILSGESAGTLSLTASEAAPHGLAALVVRASDRNNAVPSNETKADLLLRGPPGSLDESFATKGVAQVPLISGNFGAIVSQADG